MVETSGRGKGALRLPPSPPFFYGSGTTEVPFGDGVLCVGGPLRRLAPPLIVDGLGRQSLWLDLDGHPQDEITAGSTWHFQGWFRDPAAAGTGFTTTNGLRLTRC